jgi:hypothetical protein
MFDSVVVVGAVPEYKINHPLELILALLYDTPFTTNAGDNPVMLTDKLSASMARAVPVALIDE